MKKKYWVPAIERADKIINIIAQKPNEYRLIDLSNELDINKSSLFSSLNTLETLGWVKKGNDDTYTLGMRMGILSALYFSQFDLISTFSIKSVDTVNKLGETVQLSIIEGTDIIYLSKKEGSSPVRLATDPGMRLSAHSTAMGKVHLSKYDFKQLEDLYSGVILEPRTSKTVTTLEELGKQIEEVNESGFIWEHEEAVEGFVCVAAPIKNHEDEIIAAVSVTMLASRYEEKREQAELEIIDLAKQVSLKAGYNLSV